MSSVVVPAVALGRSLEVSGVGEDDGPGLGQHQDGRRVAALTVVELGRDVTPGEDSHALHLTQGRHDLCPVLVVGGVEPSMGAAANNPPGNIKTVSSELRPDSQRDVIQL